MKIKTFSFFAAGMLALSLFSCNEIDPNEPGALVPKTVDQDSSLPSIAVNGTLLHSEAFGNPDDPMIVFLHGGPGADYRNGLNAKELSEEGYYVVFYDQRGSGLSKRHDKNSITIANMLDDLDAVIEYYRTSPTQKIFLLGHSWGGILAAGYINLNPAKISGAVFAEAGGFTDSELADYGKLTRKINLFNEATNDILYLDQFLNGTENQHQVVDYKLNVSSSYVYASGNTEGIPGPSPFWRNGAATLNGLAEIADTDGFNFTTNLSAYQTRVLFLYGELNTAYGLSFAQREASYFPNHEIQRVNGAGHEMFYFNWDEMHFAVLDYFNSLN